MAYYDHLADRVRNILVRRRGITEKLMFGGLSFMAGGKMACGVIGKKLVVRIPPDQTALYLKRQHTRPMNFTGRSLAGFLYVVPDGYKKSADLKKWVTLSVSHVATLKPAKRKPARKKPAKRKTTRPVSPRRGKPKS